MSVRGSPRSRPPRSHLTFKVPAVPHVTASMKIQTRWQSASIRHWLPPLWSNSTLCFLLHEAVRLRAVVEPAVAVEPDSLCDGLQTKQKGYHLHRQHFYPLWEIEGGECLSVPLFLSDSMEGKGVPHRNSSSPPTVLGLPCFRPSWDGPAPLNIHSCSWCMCWELWVVLDTWISAVCMYVRVRELYQAFNEERVVTCDSRVVSSSANFLYWWWSGLGERVLHHVILSTLDFEVEK